MAPVVQQLADRIPDEHEVRARLAENLREADFLRSLLRVSRRKPQAADPRNERKEAASASH